MRFEATISAFAAALGEHSTAPPATTRGRLDAPDARRFSVYRNNIAVGLIGALEARYPVSRRIAGDDAFRAIARAFVRAPKPRSPVMIAYGEDFPEFAAAAGVEAHLVDVARLENAWVESYHAEDEAAATVGDLAQLSPDCLPETRIAFHPAVRMLRFSTPAASIWASRQGGDGPAAPAQGVAEDALITRPEAEVRVRILPPLGYEFALRLRDGATLTEAALALDDPAFEFGTHLVGLVESGAVASLIPGDPS